MAGVGSLDPSSSARDLSSARSITANLEGFGNDSTEGTGWKQSLSRQISKSAGGLEKRGTLNLENDAARQRQLEAARKMIAYEDANRESDLMGADVPSSGWLSRTFSNAKGFMNVTSSLLSEQGPGARASATQKDHKDHDHHKAAMREAKLKEQKVLQSQMLLGVEMQDVHHDLKHRTLGAGEYALMAQQEAIKQKNAAGLLKVGFGSKMVSPIIKSSERARAAREAENKLEEERKAAEEAMEARNLHEWLEAGLVRDHGALRGKKPLPPEYETAEYANPKVPLIKTLENNVVIWPVRFDLVPLFLHYEESDAARSSVSSTTVFHYTSYKNFTKIVAPPRGYQDEEMDKETRHLGYAEEIWDRVDDDLCSRRIEQIPGASEFSLALLATEPCRFDSKEHLAQHVFRTKDHLKQRVPSVSYCIALCVPTDKCLALAGQEYQHVVLILAPGEDAPDEDIGMEASGTGKKKKKRGVLVSWQMRSAYQTPKEEEYIVDAVREMNLLTGLLDGGVHHEDQHEHRPLRDRHDPASPKAIADKEGSGKADKEGDSGTKKHHHKKQTEAPDEAEERLIERLAELDTEKQLVIRKMRHADIAQEKFAAGETVHFLTMDGYRKVKLEKELEKIEVKIREVQKGLRELEASSTIVMKTTTGISKARNTQAAVDESTQRVMRRRRHRNKNSTEFVGEVQSFVHEISEEYHNLAGDIFREVFGGHIQGVEDWLEAKGDPNSYDPASGWTPLLMAVFMGDPKMVKLLVEKGALPTVGSLEAGLVPMHLASRRATTEMVKVMIGIGGQCARSVREKAKDGTTPLMLCIDKGYVQVRDEMVRLMLEAHADPNAERNDGWSPLSYAVRLNMKKCIKLLIQHGGKVLNDVPHHPGQATMTVWQMAAMHHGLQALIKSKLSSRDLQQLEKRFPGTLGLPKKDNPRPIFDDEDDLF